MLRDRVTGMLEKLSVSTGGVAAEQECTDVSMSADGRHVVFSSMSNNLALGGSPYWAKVFIRDRVAGLTGLVSRAIPAYAGSGSGMAAAISADGRNVVFASSAEIVPNRSAQFWALYLLNLDTDSAHQVDVGAGSAPSDRSFDPSRPAAISGNGRFVAFPSIGTNLDPADQNAGVDVYLRDVAGDTTRLLSATADGTQGVSGAFSANSVISADSQVVAFQSTAHNLVPGDANRAHDVFAWSRATGAMELVSIPAGGSASEGYDPDLSAGGGPLAISETGRYVAFSSYVTLVPGDANNEPDVFVRDREAQTTTRVSLADGGAEGNRGASPVGRLGMSGDGRFICFCSYSSNLVPGDTNERADVFVRDRLLNRTDGSGTGPERAGRCGRLSPGPGRSG
jgi:Tol biopolymer transport system component